MNEKRQVRIHNTCIHLEEIDRQIRHEAEVANKAMSDRVTKWKEDFANMQRHNDDIQREHKMRLASLQETCSKHKEMLDENKHMLSANQDLISKVSSKLQGAKDSLSNEITMTRDEIMQKMNEHDSFYVDQMATIDKKITNDKNAVNKLISDITTEFQTNLEKKIEELHGTVMT
jgi:hypothetical protein